METKNCRLNTKVTNFRVVYTLGIVSNQKNEQIRDRFIKEAGPLGLIYSVVFSRTSIRMYLIFNFITPHVSVIFLKIVQSTRFLYIWYESKTAFFNNCVHAQSIWVKKYHTYV